MAGKEYRAREKKVQKMSRDGLMEENLSDGSQTSISHKAEAPRKYAPRRKNRIPGTKKKFPQIEKGDFTEKRKQTDRSQRNMKRKNWIWKKSANRLKGGFFFAQNET